MKNNKQIRPPALVFALLILCMVISFTCFLPQKKVVQTKIEAAPPVEQISAKPEVQMAVVIPGPVVLEMTNEAAIVASNGVKKVSFSIHPELTLSNTNTNRPVGQ